MFLESSYGKLNFTLLSFIPMIIHFQVIEIAFEQNSRKLKSSVKEVDERFQSL